MASLEQPSLAEEAANHGPGIVAGNLVVAILATIAVALRFLSRYIQKIGFKSDDYLILLALVGNIHCSSSGGCRLTSTCGSLLDGGFALPP